MSENHHDDDKTQSFVTLSKGTQVNHYKIISKIGAGGMGEVYLAEDTELDRKVALKFLPPHLCQDEDCRKRFKREAQAAAKLSHPNIIHVYEVSEYQGRPFFAMEHVEGETLNNKEQYSNYTIRQKLEIVLQICDGIQSAHNVGIIHRDIKPSNIIVDSKGRVRIVDFGLAIIRGVEKITKPGSIIGSVGYMSPEQVEGKEIDIRSDIFSLSVVIYRFVSGVNPFKKSSNSATMYAILHDTPKSLNHVMPNCPKKLDNIIQKGLRKIISERYQNIDELIYDLSQLESKTNDLLDNLRPIMIAVLPYDNLGHPDDEYFADGITDEIISKLAKFQELGVISRTSIKQYKNLLKKIKDIGFELGVDYILEGTIKWDKSTTPASMRIHSQLIKVSDDVHLWSDTTEAQLSEVFRIQSDIAENVVKAIGLTLIKKKNEKLRVSETSVAKAYDCVLKGIYYYERAGTSDYDVKLSLGMFKKAQEYDPNYARAYAWESIVHSVKYHWGHDRSQESIIKAKESADKAYKLSSNHSDTHLALGYYYYRCKRDFDNALNEFKIAASISPGLSKNYSSIAYVQRRKGLYRDCFKNLEKAKDLSPLDYNPYLDIGITYHHLRNYQDADRWIDKAIALAPDVQYLYNRKIFLYFDWKGDPSLVRKILSEMSDIFGEDEVLWELGFVEVAECKYEKAIKTFKKLIRLQKKDKVNTNLEIAHIYNLLGNKEEAYKHYKLLFNKVEKIVKKHPDDYLYYGRYGIALAGLGEKEKALEYGIKATRLCTLDDDAMDAPYHITNLAEIYTIIGEYDLAIEQLEVLLSVPYGISISSLKLYSSLYRLRNHPRFQALLEKYDTTN